ncbi:response regulator [Candidatus Riflebacteria bacterium]
MQRNSGKKSPRFMIIDDSMYARELIKQNLLQIYDDLSDDNIKEFPGAVEALDDLQNADPDSPMPDLIICDLIMPEMDGLTFIKKVRANPGLKELPIFVVSAQSAHSKVIGTLKAGGNGYLSKPYSNEIFQEKILQILKKQKEQKKNNKKEDS